MATETKSDVLVHNNWDPLEEIWLGDVYPKEFYDDLKPEIREAFHILTDWTKEDLNIIQKKLEEFNVVVRRPKIDGDRSQYTIGGKTLLKPPICPRDTNGVIGNKLFVSPNPKESYTDLLSLYNNVYDMKSNDVPKVYGHCLVKLGKDLIFDNSIWDQDAASNINKFLTLKDKKIAVFRHFRDFQRITGEMFSDYRIHYSTNGGHVDGCFMPVKPGLLLTTRYWNEYDKMFPDWKCINIRHPSYITAGKELRGNGGNGKWITFVEGLPGHFNHFVYKHCQDWIGNYKETYFEVNMIMIDENNMLCFDSAKANEPVYEELDKHGVKCHIVPWRTRGFWDGGLHCITLDTKRKAVLKDYFPERGDAGIKTVLCQGFGNSTEKFFEEYNLWLKEQ